MGKTRGLRTWGESQHLCWFVRKLLLLVLANCFWSHETACKKQTACEKRTELTIQKTCILTLEVVRSCVNKHALLRSSQTGGEPDVCSGAGWEEHRTGSGERQFQVLAHLTPVALTGVTLTHELRVADDRNDGGPGPTVLASFNLLSSF